jgi:VWFA-related protein
MTGSSALRIGSAILSLSAAFLLAQTPAPRNPPRAARQALDRADKAEKKNQIPEARRAYEEAVALYPDYAEAWCDLGLLEARGDEFAAARRSFRRALAADSTQICPYLPLALLEYQAKDWPTLLEVTDRMLRLDAIDYPIAHLLNGVAHYNLGEYDEAAKAARAAEALDNRHFPQIWELLGWVEANHGNDAAAALQFQKYLESAPMGADAEAVRDKLALLAGRLSGVPPAAELGPVFKVDANLALIQFAVIPKQGQPASPLKPEDIEVREDGVLKDVALLENARADSTVPMEIALLFDCSASVTGAGALDPYVFQEKIFDEYENVSIAIYAFSDALTVLTGPIRDARVLRKAMDAVLALPSRDTRLFGAIADASREAARSRSNAVHKMIVFSDGISESYQDSDLDRRDDAARTARRLGIVLYPVVLATSGPAHGSRSDYRVASSNRSVQSFIGLAAATGGQALTLAAGDSSLPESLKSLAALLPYTYVAGYYPATSGGNKAHEAQVFLLNKSKGELSGGSRVVTH